MAKTENKKENLKHKKQKHLIPPKSPVSASLSLEVTSILIICFSILLIISIFFGSGGFLGKALSSFFKGLFGIGAYFLPIIMIVSSVYIFFVQTNKINIFKLVLAIISFILLISFFHIITRQDINNFSSYFTYLANEYRTAKFLDGGILGALIGDLFIKIIGVLGSYIVILILFVASIFLLAGKSFFKTVYTSFKNLSNYFYYEYDVKEDFKDDKNVDNLNRKSIFSKIKEIILDRKNSSSYYEEEQEIEQPPPPPISKRTPKKLPNPDIILSNTEFETPRRIIKRYDNYLFDGIDKYKRIEKPVFFDMNKNPKSNKDKKILFAIDEINNPQNYNNKNLNNTTKANNIDISNKNLNNTLDSNIYSTTANIIKDFENDISTKNKDLFEIKSKEEYVNNICKKKYTKSATIDNKFSIDLKFANDTSIEDIFENPPEEFLENEVADDLLDNLDEFYNFDDGINEDIPENLDSDIKDNNHLDLDLSYNPSLNDNENIPLSNDITLDDDEDLLLHTTTPLDYDDNKDKVLSNNIAPTQNNNTSYMKKDNDGFTIINQNNNINNKSYKNVDKMEEKEQNINEPIIIKPDVEKMVTNLYVEEDVKKEYIFPQLSFLSKNPNVIDENNDIELRENSYILVKTLKSFNVNAQVINISKGPSVTRYELSIEDGIKVSKILGLADNLALSLAASSIRIEAPIPGKSAVGIEIPNKEVKSVFLSEVICAEKFQKFPSKVAFGLGKDITGNVIVTDIAKMPHMLIAGATGSGKSVCINTLITSILYKANPEEVKLMMIDPKVVELSVYNGIPHLLTPVVTEPEKAAGVLNWAVSEMMERYNLFAQTGTRNLVGYNSLKEENNEPKLPQIIIIIDELADLMMVAAKEVEASICRLAQLARAAGIHLIIATQRPSVDVITGLIKANIPSRIAFAVSSGTDSRTVLDTVGAEKLLGKGDMLFRSVDMNKPLRIQGAFISDKEVEHIVTFIKENSSPNYDENIINKIENSAKSNDNISSDNSDELTEDVISFLVKKGKASTSMIQRQFRIGYNRAARIIEELEDRGIVSSENGSKQRDVLMDRYQYEEYLNRYDNY
ncbi:DNA translocase FtsK 4TM domain-containing protein [uncultured Tyzzerella sp.]|uniref:FtsK/SpoIIIE family DNA translocase n=1 Tax=uncultured Tyzzerella sp. TaxID=2321398 RepID=UPI002942F75C|nr:DNA translocase FtsK 4TM domain-containing protein [uncultured Tyzzerella sp.]